jgi:hypothetical protein
MIQNALMNPKKADLNKDRKLSSYEKKRGAAIEKNIAESTSKHTVKYSKSNDTYQVWLADEIVTDFATKEKADAEAKRLNALQDVKRIDKAQVNEASDNEIILSNEILDFLEERGIIDPSDAQKVHKDLTSFLKSKIIKQGNLDEDLDLGHTDNEPHMLKADLYRIGKYAMELYKMVDKFDNDQEVDFPHWWQAKIINAKSCLVSAKHYLDFELKEPQIDAMVDVASEEGALGENAMEDINYRNSNNTMRSVYDLAKKFQDVELFKNKWYEIYSRGLQDKDADTDEWLENIFRKAQYKTKSNFLPSTSFSNQLYSKPTTISNQLYSRITEGLFDRIKSQVKATSSNIGQRVKNVGAAIQGKPEDFKNPWVTSGMSKIKSKAQNFESDVKDMLNDLNILFPEEKLEKAPGIKDLINSYQNLLNSVLKANTALSKGTPVNVTNKSTSTPTAPKPTTPTPKPATSKPSTPEKPSTPKSLTVKPTTSSSQLYSRPTTTTSKTSTRDEKGRFISNKK